MTVKLITLKNMVTIMADVEDVFEAGDEGHMRLIKPVQIFIQHQKDGPMMAFSPFIDYAEEFNTGVKLSMADIMTINTPRTELLNQYSEMFGTGIQIASSVPKF